jgi:hypothetical protein
MAGVALFAFPTKFFPPRGERAKNRFLVLFSAHYFQVFLRFFTISSTCARTYLQQARQADRCHYRAHGWRVVAD